MVCRYQVTKISCAGYLGASAFSAKCPCNFGPFARVAISVLRELRKTHSASQVPLSVEILDCAVLENQLRPWLKLLRPTKFQ